MSSTPPSTPPSPSTNTSTLSDIFSSSPSPSPPPNPSHPSHNPPHPSHQPPLEPSDIPRLRSTHITSGYRHGISTSKTDSLQPGFDEGYSLGAVFGLRIGTVIGLLEGLYYAYATKTGEGDEKERIGKLLRQAREELAVERVFGEKWWGEEGWRYEVVVGHGHGEGEATWMEVVEQHPVVREWERRVGEEVERRGVRRGVFEGEGWDGGRVEG